MALLALSTIVKKYLKPYEVGTEWGPHPSIWTSSKGESDKLLLNGKGKHFYFAMGQIIQSWLRSFCEIGKTWTKEWSLKSDGCPNLECQSLDKELIQKELIEMLDKAVKALAWFLDR